MHARISMSKLNGREDRSMIAHACYECARRVLFFSDIIYSGHYLDSLMASPVRNRRCRWKLELYVSLIGEDCSIGGAICVCV